MIKQNRNKKVKNNWDSKMHININLKNENQTKTEIVFPNKKKTQNWIQIKRLFKKQN